MILWSWERREDLRFVDTRRFGVAFLAATVTLEGAHAMARPRAVPLRMPPGIARLAVVRLESSRGRLPTLSAAQRAEAVAALLHAGRTPGCAGLQVDFDATRRERGFYRDLLRDLRAGLPDTLAISITALASWCDGDRWLADLPVDEIVPMFFRMGRDERNLSLRLERGGDLTARECGEAVGVSLDERRRAPPRRRVYVFSPHAWTPREIKELDSWLAR